MEDLLEEIVGEVTDEFDTGRPPIEEQADGSVLLDGLLPIDEVDERFGLGVEEPFYDTLGGYIFGQLQRAPQVGDTVPVTHNRLLRVEELDGLRVARVRLLPAGVAPAPATQPPSERDGHQPHERRADDA